MVYSIILIKLNMKLSSKQLKYQKKLLRLQEDAQKNSFNIIKGGCCINDDKLRNIVEKMISQKMEQDRYCQQSFPYKHMSCVLCGISEQWKANVNGRELYAGGT